MRFGMSLNLGVVKIYWLLVIVTKSSLFEGDLVFQSVKSQGNKVEA